MEQLYQFVDKTGRCFDDFAIIDEYTAHIASWLHLGKKFIVGDMLVFRDDLINAGFKWGVDFYAQKVSESPC